MTVRERVKRWPVQWRERWIERAAIREYDGGQDRPAAELAAYREVLNMIAISKSKPNAEPGRSD